MYIAYRPTSQKLTLAKGCAYFGNFKFFWLFTLIFKKLPGFIAESIKDVGYYDRC